MSPTPEATSKPFISRRHAGQLLGRELVAAGHDVDLVFALPRGGVPVAAEVAAAFAVPLDVLVVRKLGAPSQPELAIGAIGPGGVRVMNDELVAALRLDDETIARVIETESRELARRESLYRGDRLPLDISGRAVVVVDDGVATGATMSVALQTLRELGARAVVVAVPVGAPDSLARLRLQADAVLSLLEPPDFGSVGQWYGDFTQTSDDEVGELLAAHGDGPGRSG